MGCCEGCAIPNAEQNLMDNCHQNKNDWLLQFKRSSQVYITISWSLDSHLQKYYQALRSQRYSLVSLLSSLLTNPLINHLPGISRSILESLRLPRQIYLVTFLDTLPYPLPPPLSNLLVKVAEIFLGSVQVLYKQLFPNSEPP